MNSIRLISLDQSSDIYPNSYPLVNCTRFVLMNFKE